MSHFPAATKRARVAYLKATRDQTGSRMAVVKWDHGDEFPISNTEKSYLKTKKNQHWYFKSTSEIGHKDYYGRRA